MVCAGRRADRLPCSGPPAGVAQLAEQPSCKRQVSGSNPLTGSQTQRFSSRFSGAYVHVCFRHPGPRSGSAVAAAMSSAFRVGLMAFCAVWEVSGHAAAAVAVCWGDCRAAIAEWGVSTRQTNEGFIRRTIKPALGHLEVRKVRGPILDKLYTRLKRCGDLSCSGRPFTEHRNVPALTINRDDFRPAVPSLACAGPTSVALGWPWSWVSRIAAAALRDASGT